MSNKKISLVLGIMCLFLVYAISFKFDFYYFNIYKIINFVFGILYFVSLFIIAGIDKENKNIQNSLLIYGLVISVGYIIYVCTHSINSVYSYGIYLFVMLISIIINSILVHKYKKHKYIIQLVELASYMIIFSGILGIVITLSIWILITAIIYLIKLEVLGYIY